MLPPHSCRARPHHRHHRNQQNVARQSLRVMSVFCGDSCVQQATLIPLYPSHPHVHNRIHVCVIASHNTLHYPGLGASILAKSFLTPAHRPPVASAAPARIRHRPSIIPYAVCRNPKQCVPPHPSSHATASLMSCTPTSSSSQESTKCSPAITSSHVGGRFWPLAAGFKSRRTRPCTVFGAQNTSAGVFGRLPQASKVAERGPAPFSGLRIRRRAFLAACRRLQKSPNAALHRFRGSEYVGGRFWPLAAGFKSRRTRPCTVFGAQNTSAGVFGRLPQASKVAERGPAPFSGLRIRRRAFLAACRRLQKSPNAALHRFRGSEYVGGRFWPLAAGFKSRRTRPCTVFGAQNTSAGVFGRLPQASKVAERGPAPFSGLRIRRRAFLAACRRLQKSPNAALHRFRGSEYVGGRFLAACRRLQKSPNAALHRFRGSEYVGGRFWPLAAGFKSRRTRPCTVFGAQNTSAGVFGRLPQASKVAERGPAPFSGLRIRRRAFLAACRRLQKSPNAALHRFRGSEYVGGRFWPLAAGFKSRRTRPCTVFGAQNTSAGVFGRLPQASKVAERGPAPFSGLRIRRRAFLAACRRLQKSPNAALHRFRGSEYVGGRFWPLAAGFKSRRTRPCTVFGAQNTSAGVFGRLPQASKVAERGPAPFSGLRIRRRAFLAACRRLQKSPNAALHRFRGSEYVGGRFWPLAAGFKSRRTRPCTVFGAQNTSAGVFWPLAAGFKSRRTRPCTVFGAQNTSAGVFGRLPQASKVAERGPAPFSGLRIRRRAFLAACRRLQKSPNAALHRFRGSEYVGGRFWPLAAGFKSRRTRPCTVFGAQNTSAGVFGRLPQASKVAERGPAPFSGLRIRRRAFFGRLPQASKVAERGPAPFSGLRIRRRAFLAACRRLQKSPNAALHRFRGSEYVGGRFWPLAAGFKSRRTRPCTVFGAQNTSAGVFGRLPQASKVAERGPAPFSGLRIRRRAFFGRLPQASKVAERGPAPFSGLRIRRRAFLAACRRLQKSPNAALHRFRGSEYVGGRFLAACRRLQKSPNAALHRFRGSEYVGGRFWPLAAGFKSRRTRPCTVFGAQNTSAGVFGRLPQASKVAERGPAPFSGLRIRRRAFLAACRRLQKSPNAALHRFRGSEYVGGRFWPLAAGFKSRRTRPCTVFGAQNTSAGVFGRLPQASKVAERGPAPFSGLRIRRRAFLAACRRLQKSPNAALHRFRGSEYVGGRFLAACRRLQKSPNAALHRFRGSEYVGGRFWPLAAGFKSRRTRPCTVFGAQNTSAGVFGRLPQASKVAERGPAPFSGLRIRRRAFLAACRRLASSLHSWRWGSLHYFLRAGRAAGPGVPLSRHRRDLTTTSQTRTLPCPFRATRRATPAPHCRLHPDSVSCLFANTHHPSSFHPPPPLTLFPVFFLLSLSPWPRRYHPHPPRVRGEG